MTPKQPQPCQPDEWLPLVVGPSVALPSSYSRGCCKTLSHPSVPPQLGPRCWKHPESLWPERYVELPCSLSCLKSIGGGSPAADHNSSPHTGHGAPHRDISQRVGGKLDGTGKNGKTQGRWPFSQVRARGIRHWRRSNRCASDRHQDTSTCHCLRDGQL